MITRGLFTTALALFSFTVLGSPTLKAGTSFGTGALSRIPGWVVFDSKRDGQFDIYKMRPDGSEVTRLTDTPQWEECPDWSPNGRQVIFARRQPGDDSPASDIYIMDADGGNERLLIKGGTFPQFTLDGKAIIFERDRVKIVYYIPGSRSEHRLTPPHGGPPFKHYMIKPSLSPDEKTVLFVSDKKGKWHTWAMDMEGTLKLIGRGCQPTWHPDGKRIFYIRNKAWQDNSIWTFNWPDGPAEEYLALSGTYRHVYFPSVSDDGKYLLFSACPANLHDHTTAPYQIFIKALDGGVPVRLSWNEYTERWPRLSTAAR